MIQAKENVFDFAACLNGRCKELDPARWSYKLADQQYGMDFTLSDDLGIDEKRMSVWINFADGNRRDGVGDLLEVEGIDTNRHRKNPIILWDHGKQVQLPVALAEDPVTKAYTVEIDPVSRTARANAFFYQGKGLDATTPSEEYNHAVFCEQLFDLIARRFVRAGSIGYQVVAAKQLQPDYQQGTPQGLHLLRVLMLECSAVVLPANGDTVRKTFPTVQAYNEWIDGIRKALALPKVCGKPLSPYLIKSLEPFVRERKVTDQYDRKAFNRSASLANIGFVLGTGRANNDVVEACFDVVGAVDFASFKIKLRSASDQQLRQVLETINRMQPGSLPAGWDQSSKSYDNPLSNSNVPPARWKPGVGAIKEVRAKYRKKSTLISEVVTGSAVRRTLQAAGITPKAVTDLGDRIVVVVDRGRFDAAWKVLYNTFESVAADYNAIYVYHPVKAMDQKSLDNLRVKYRPGAKGRVRRLRKSSPGSALVYVAGKDLERLKQTAEAKGIGFRRAGVKGDLEKVRLTGDDTVIDGIAKQFGRAVKMLTKGNDVDAQYAEAMRKLRAYVASGLDGVRQQAWDRLRALGINVDNMPPNQEGALHLIEHLRQMGVKSMRTKDMTDDNGSINGSTTTPAGDADLNDDGMVSEQEAEKYGAQLLRDMHEVFQELMERWDAARGPLEQAKVDSHVEKVLTDIGKHLDSCESLWEELYADLDPLEGAGESKDMDTMDDAATPADSDDEREEDEPTPDEAVEGMEKKRNKRILTKTRVRYGKKGIEVQTKAKKKKGGKDSQWGARYQGAYEWAEENNVNDPEGTAAAIANGPKHLYHILTKSVCPDCGVADCKCGSKDLTQDEAEEMKEDLTEQVNDSELKPEEKRMVKEAVGFLGEVAETPEWTEEHRMKSYHYHKNLDPIGMIEDAIGGITGEEEVKAAAPGDPSDPQALKQMISEMIDRAGRAEKRGDQRSAQDYHREADRLTELYHQAGEKDLTEDEASQLSGDMTEQVEDTETKSARKMCKDCSLFLKDLSLATELMDDHRSKAMDWHKQLGPFGEEAMDGEPDAMESDEEPVPMEPGDMDTKSLRKEIEEQDRLVKEMEKKLASINF